MGEQDHEFEQDVEGHQAADKAGLQDDDVEGHRVRNIEEDDDVEGHRVRNIEEDDDVEGHRVSGFVDDEEDVEGHRLYGANVQPPRDTDLGGSER